MNDATTHPLRKCGLRVLLLMLVRKTSQTMLSARIGIVSSIQPIVHWVRCTIAYAYITTLCCFALAVTLRYCIRKGVKFYHTLRVVMRESETEFEEI